MIATATLSARLEQLTTERELHRVRYVVSDHQLGDRIAMLTAQIKAAKAERAAAQRAWEKNDQAFGALIGDYARLKQDALADDAAAHTDAADPAGEDAQWQQLRDEAADAES